MGRDINTNKTRQGRVSNDAPQSKAAKPVVVPIDWRKVLVPVDWMKALGGFWKGLSRKARVGAYATFAAAVSYGGYAVAAAGHAGSANDAIEFATTVYYYVTDHSGHVMADQVAREVEEKLMPLYDSLNATVVGLPISKKAVAAVKNDPRHYNRVVTARASMMSDALNDSPKLAHDADMLIQHVNRAYGCVEDGCNERRIARNLQTATCVFADLFGDYIFEKRMVRADYGENLLAARAKVDCKTVLYGKAA